MVVPIAAKHLFFFLEEGGGLRYGTATWPEGRWGWPPTGTAALLASLGDALPTPILLVFGASRTASSIAMPEDIIGCAAPWMTRIVIFYCYMCLPPEPSPSAE